MKRRDMMRSLAAAAAFVPVSVPANEPASVENCRDMALRIAALMKEISGGEWRVNLQPDFIMIFRKVA